MKAISVKAVSVKAFSMKAVSVKAVSVKGQGEASRPTSKKDRPTEKEVKFC